MVFNKIIKLLLLMSTAVTSAHAGTSQATSVSGPSFLFNSSVTRPRAILHAFDVPITSALSTSRTPTFKCDPGFSGTYTNFNTATMGPIDQTYLGRASTRGYTHIQISPMQFIPKSSNIWSAAYQPYIMILNDPNYTDQTQASYASYLADVKNALATAGKPTVSDLTRYGVSIPDTAKTSQTITVGYMLNSPLYGSITDLATMIANAKGQNIGVIADVVFDQANFGMIEQPLPLPDNNQIVAAKLHPMKIDTNTAGASQDTTRNFPAGFFTPDDLTKNNWQFGAQLNLSNSYVQQMAVGYLRLLYDLGIAGVRVDDLPIISATSITPQPGQDAQYLANQQSAAIWKSIFTKASTSYTYTPQGSSTSVTLPGFSFNCGYGEYFWSYGPQVSPFVPVMPLVDFVMQSSLAGSCLANPAYGSVSNLLMPAALGNTQSAIPFTVVHDMYPNVSNKRFTFYEDSNHGSGVTDPSQQAHFPNALKASNCVICAAQRTNPAFIINSQLAIAYLLAKRDGSPLILRFEDEAGQGPTNGSATGDFAGIIQNALAFRTAMDTNNAPHEYISVLDTNTLLIARQYGFAVINMASSDRTISLTDLQKVPAAYIPDTTYTSGRGSYYIDLSDGIPNGPSPSTPSGKYYTKSSTTGFTLIGGSGSTAVVPSRNIKFFVLQNPSSLSSRSVVFQITTPLNFPPFGQQVCVLGNHPLLGGSVSSKVDGSITSKTPIARPDFLNVMINTTNNTSGTNIWKTIPFTFPSDTNISYEYGTMSLDSSGTTTTIQNIEKSKNRILKVPSGSGSQEEGGGTYEAPAVPSITFSLTTSKTNVYLIGSVAELGSWNAASAILMSPSSSSGVLTKSITFSAPNITLTYKYITKSGSSITWSPGNNLTVVTGSTPIQKNDTW